MKSTKIVLMFVAIAVFLPLAMGSSGCSTGSSKVQQRDSKITETYAKRFEAAVPYPLDLMKTSLERQNLRRRLLLENQPNKIGYVYIINFGKVIGYYVIKGKVSSTQSQLTITQQVTAAPNNGSATVDSMGDDGSYGPNEGGQNGVFFFTASGTWVETDLEFLYADQPLPIDVPLLGK